MPELPEVECIRRGLEELLVGDCIVKATVLRKESIAAPSAKQFVKNIVGHKFASFNRRGKYLLMKLSDNAGLACHLRMSGALIVKNSRDIESPHLRVRIELQSGRQLHFEDMRVFGRLWYVANYDDLPKVITGLSKMGPEPLAGLSASYLVEKLATRKQAIKTALLDQELLAGVGNIYADEALFASGIHPQMPASALTKKQVEKLIEKIRAVLLWAIKSGGSSIRDYKDSLGVNGNYQNEASVYGLAGKKCKQCKRTIEKVKLAGRSSHFCPGCQKLTVKT